MGVDYARLDYLTRQHHARFKRYVETRPRKLVCQECRGAGGHVEPVLDWGEGPWEDCGWCEGTGLVSGYIRGVWLREKRKEAKRHA
jgi:hypothetical protein